MIVGIGLNKAGGESKTMALVRYENIQRISQGYQNYTDWLGRTRRRAVEQVSSGATKSPVRIDHPKY